MKMVWLLLTICLYSYIFSQDFPTDGDIIFTQVGANNNDVIEFITLKPLNLTTLKITDNGILSDNSLRGGEGTADLSNTPWVNIPGGTFVRIGSDLNNDNDANDRIISYDGTGSSTFPNLATAGDQLIAYIGPDISPTYIAGINWGNSGWTSGANSANDSKAPGTVSDIELGNLQNYYFSSSVSGDASTTRNSVKNSSNWFGSNSRLGYQDLRSNIGANALPVELSSFTATVGNNSVMLNWRTETEVDNSGFEIQRSEVSDQTNWKKIGFVNGSGNSNSPKSYTFTDDLSLTPNLNHTLNYRLKQIDTDGDYEYSDVIEVDPGMPDEFVLA